MLYVAAERKVSPVSKQQISPCQQEKVLCSGLSHIFYEWILRCGNNLNGMVSKKCCVNWHWHGVCGYNFHPDQGILQLSQVREGNVLPEDICEEENRVGIW